MSSLTIKKLYTPIPLLTTLLCIALVILIDMHYPAATAIHYPMILVGAIPIGISIYIFISFGKLFYKYKTTVRPGEIPTSLITEGIYRHTRNPVYVADILVILGVTIFVGNLFSLLASVIFFVTVNSIIIPFEEKRLFAVFGDEYKRYCDSVRRWI